MRLRNDLIFRPLIVAFPQYSNVPVFHSSHPLIDWDHDHEKSLY